MTVFNRPGAPYSASARLIALLLVDTFQQDDSENWSGWTGLDTLARRANLNVTTVRRAMRQLVDGPLPLLARSKSYAVHRQGKHRNAGRKSYTYCYVWDPSDFAAKRDAARAAAPPSTPGDGRRANNLPRRDRGHRAAAPQDVTRELAALVAGAVKSIPPLPARIDAEAPDQAERVRAQIAADRVAHPEHYSAG